MARSTPQPDARSDARSDTERALREKTTQLQAITEAMTAFLDRGDWGRASQRLLEGAFALTSSEYGFVGVVIGGTTFRVLAHAGIVWDAVHNREFYERALASYRRVGYLEFHSLDNLFGRVLQTGKALIANDAARHPFARGLPAGHPPLRSFLGVPFLWGDKVVGMMGVANRPGGFTAQEQRQLENFARTAGVLYDSYLRQLKEAEMEAQRHAADQALRESNHRLERAVADLRNAQEQIVREERLRAIGMMASGITHDFNNALQPILGFSELLLVSPERLRDEESARGYLEMIHAAAEDAQHVVHRLREFHRQPEPHRPDACTALNPLVEKIVQLTQLKWKDEAMARSATIRVRLELCDVPPVAVGDGELREVLTNLIFNAVDALPQGGLIVLRTRAEADDVVLEVSDTGVGMSEELRQRCFEPFFSTKGAPGTGLGLAMVQGIVQRHQGRVEAESTPGCGTTIRLSFPARHGVARVPESHAAAKRPDADRAALRILLVDDDARVRRAVATFLTRDGHSVEAAASAREGFECFRSGRFDLVITDQAMPEMSGVQLAEALRQLAPQQRIVLLTGFGYAPGGEARPAAVDLVVDKPVRLAALREAVRSVMERQPTSRPRSGAAA